MDIDEFLENYSINQHIWNSDETSAIEKAAAWRQQMLIVHHLSRNLSQSDQYDLFKLQHEKTSSKVFDDFIDYCVDGVESLIPNYNRLKIEEVSSVVGDFPNLDKDSFELPCRGVYESCIHNEVNEEELKEVFQSTVPQHQGSLIKSAATKRKLDDFTPPLPRSSVQTFLVPSLRPPNALFVNKAEDSQEVDKTKPNSQNSGFRTAREELVRQNQKKKGNGQSNSFNYGTLKKSLGARRGVSSSFVPPIRAVNQGQHRQETAAPNDASNSIHVDDERLVNIDPKMIEVITNEIMHNDKPVEWHDIAGLNNVKSIIKEAVVYPLMRPDLFEGSLGTARGILLFGPPGTGKTMFGKCIASQSKSTFFNISASTLTSKWVGEGEKMVRALFAVAAVYQPSVIFIDEIDSLLCQRSDSENEGTRRLKTEFMIQFDGAATRSEDQILLVGATNRPQELDEAVRRRFTRRLYIPLPELAARRQIVHNLIQKLKTNLSTSDIEMISEMTEGYSAADVKTLCSEAFLGPLRSIPYEQIPYIKKEDMRPVSADDFRSALKIVPPSVAQADLNQYIEWNRIYGALR